MRTLLLAGVALAILGAASPTFAQSNDAKAVTGAAGGGATGAIVGGLIGGPIGAIVGGFSGAVIGSEAAVPDTVVVYAGAHPVERVTVAGDLAVGGTISDPIQVYPTDDPKFGYFYANNRVYIVDTATKAIVASPGYLIPEQTVAFVEANPTASIAISGANVAAGYQVPADVQLVAIPDDQYYSYAFINDRPVLVDNSTRTVVWVR